MMARPVAPGSTAIALAGTLVVHAGAAAFLYAAGMAMRETVPPRPAVQVP